MSRIRSIKPEFWTNEQVMECSPMARLLFIGLWNFCDDHGRHPMTPKQIKALIFPADDVSVENVRRMIDELSSNGLLTLYSIENKDYLQVSGWHHQKIDRRQAAKYPGPLDEHSTNGIDGTQSTEGNTDKEAEPNGSGARAPSAEIIPMVVDARKALFDEALPLLAQYTGKPVSSLRSLAGKWLKETGDDALKVSTAIARSIAEKRSEPISWIERSLKPADPDAAIYRGVL